MLFLADENVPLLAILHLRERGLDVAAIAERRQGAGDPDVLALALAERRIILTFDKDFGELLFRDAAPAPVGVVFFRSKSADPVWAAVSLLAFLDGGGVLNGQYTTVEPEQIRQRPLS